MFKTQLIDSFTLLMPAPFLNTTISHRSNFPQHPPSLSELLSSSVPEEDISSALHPEIYTYALKTPAKNGNMYKHSPNEWNLWDSWTSI